MNVLIAKSILLIFLAETTEGTDYRNDGDSLGPLQITRIFVDDVNRILGKQWYSYENRIDYKKSTEMATVYLTYHCTRDKIGHEPDLKDYCMTFKGGPHGVWKQSALNYWDRIVVKYYKLSENHPTRKAVRI